MSEYAIERLLDHDPRGPGPQRLRWHRTERPPADRAVHDRMFETYLSIHRRTKRLYARVNA